MAAAPRYRAQALGRERQPSPLHLRSVSHHCRLSPSTADEKYMCVSVIWHFETLALIRRNASTRCECAHAQTPTPINQRSMHTCTHSYTYAILASKALEAKTTTRTQTHTHTHTHPQRSSPSLLCQGAELSSTCLGITINSIAQA